MNKPNSRVASGEMLDREGDESDSSRGWVGIEDTQISREEFMKLARQ